MRSGTAEAFDDVVLCQMSEADVRAMLLGDLQARGAVALRRGKVVVLDLARLQQLGEDAL